jgi:hypothetical protein
MAYMSQENKKSKEPLIKAILKKYGVKGSVSVKHLSTLVVSIKSGLIDFIGNYNTTGKGKRITFDGYIQVNTYWCHEMFTGAAKDCLVELREVMDKGNHDNSEPMIDHFDVGWYININIGQWDKPYVKETLSCS